MTSVSALHVKVVVAKTNQVVSLVSAVWALILVPMVGRVLVSFIFYSKNLKQRDSEKKNSNDEKLFTIIIPDTRRDLCYSQYRDGQCSNPTSTAVTKSSCCCCTVILGQPLGWGSNCQACPISNTPEFESLCPHGAGMTYNGDGS